MDALTLPQVVGRTPNYWLNVSDRVRLHTLTRTRPRYPFGDGDGYTHEYWGQQVPIVVCSFVAITVEFEAIIHPLGQSPGEKVLDGDHPEGKHSVASIGPRFIQVEPEL